MLTVSLVGVILLSNFLNMAMETRRFRTMEEVKKCADECGGAEANVERQRSGMACFTIPADPEHGLNESAKTVADPCIHTCLLGVKPDEDQVKCFYEVCTPRKDDSESDSWMNFCAGYGQKHIEQNECDLILSGKVHYHSNCTER